jgi:hypothetical protein
MSRQPVLLCLGETKFSFLKNLPGKLPGMGKDL